MLDGIKKRLISFSVVILSVVVAFFAAEGILRAKNASMKNYDIEMWKYALKLKQPSINPLIGHEHIPNQSATLQSVRIRTNEFGLRGKSIPLKSTADRRILFLGSSVTLGWGVAEEETLTGRLQQKFLEEGQSVEILNAGIANFNTQRYVELFFSKLNALHPTDIVVHYVLRDAEILTSKRNFLLRHSQLATTAWMALSRNFSKFKPSQEKYYQNIYEDATSTEFQAMKFQLSRLSQYCKENHIRLYLAMTPDLHDLENYSYSSIHDQMKSVAQELGYTFIDLLPSMQGYSGQDLWAMPGDPHPNSLGHAKMADALFPVIAKG